MKKYYPVLLIAIAFVLLLSACGGEQPPPDPAPAPQEGGEDPEPEPPPEEPGLEPIDLAGPEIGSTMTWVDGGTLVYVPPGEFIMGHGAEDNPEHPVFLDGFWIYRTEVTNRMYALCLGAGFCPPPEDPEFVEKLQDPEFRDRPVTFVKWEHGDAYCSWVNGRLPTEAQWEKTGRGPDSKLYPWGEEAPSCDLLNFDNCVGETTDVGEYPQGQSEYGAEDTAGNVLEWVWDWYDPDYYGGAPFENPLGPEMGEARSVRSSTFEDGPEQVPLARRYFLDPEEVRADLGFRCVIEDPQPFPPYCLTGGRAPEGWEPDPGDEGCELTLEVAGLDCGFVTADLEGGTITSVNAAEFDCTQVNATRVYCSGEGGGSDEVTVCGVCEGGDIPQTGAPPELDCGPGYETTTPEGNECEYQGGEPDCEPGTLPDGEGGCYYPGYPGDDCPIGTYAVGEECFGREWPGPECLPGYEYNFDLACCEFPGGDFQTPDTPGYPGCGPDEFFDTMDETCLPLETGGEGGGACITEYLTAGECGGGSRGGEAFSCPASCFSIGDQATCNACGCMWSAGSCY